MKFSINASQWSFQLMHSSEVFNQSIPVKFSMNASKWSFQSKHPSEVDQLMYPGEVYQVIHPNQVHWSRRCYAISFTSVWNEFLLGFQGTVNQTTSCQHTLSKKTNAAQWRGTVVLESK